MFNRVEEEAFEESKHQLLFVGLYYLKLVEHFYTPLNRLFNLAIEILHRHEVFGHVLTELVLEELEADA